MNVVERVDNGLSEAANDAAGRLEHLISRLDSIADPTARELAGQSIQSIVELYGEALTRVVRTVEGKDGQLLSALLKDDLLKSLFLVHDLHPQSIEDRLSGALETVRPYLMSHGGNIEIIGVNNGVARLRFQGTCKSCPSSAITMELAIRRAVEEACPDLAGLELEENKL